jgi:DNA repair protein RadC
MTYQIISERRLKHKVQILNPGGVYAEVKRYADAKKEQLILLTLDNEHSVISVSFVSIGIVNRTIVHPREVFCRAIDDKATAIIVCHNHPSGKLKPSKEDIKITSQLSQAGEIIAIPLLDHIIFSHTGYISLRTHGYFPEVKGKGKRQVK